MVQRIQQMIQTSKSKSSKGAISLEACIAVPLFIFIMMFFNGIMLMFFGEHMISHALIQSAESLSLDPFATQRVGSTSFAEAESIATFLYGAIVDADPYFASTDKWYENNDDTMREAVKKRFIGYLGGDESQNPETKADTFLKFFGVQNGLDGMDFSATQLDGNKLTIVVKYRQNYIFDFQGTVGNDLTKTFSVYLWDVATK